MVEGEEQKGLPGHLRPSSLQVFKVPKNHLQKSLNPPESPERAAK